LRAISCGILNRNGLKTGNGNRWTQERVTLMRPHHRIPLYRPAENGVEPWLNLSQAAAIVGISPKTLRLAAERGDTLSKTARGSSAAPTLTVRPHGASLRGPNATPNTPRDRTRPNKAGSSVFPVVNVLFTTAYGSYGPSLTAACRRFHGRSGRTTKPLSVNNIARCAL
jgi:hypothetical protein